MTETKELTQEQRDIIADLSYSELPDSVYLGYIAETGDDELKDFDEAYNGEWSSDEEFAQDMAENTGALEGTGGHWPLTCIDWEWAARELMMDYFEVDGHYFRSM